MAFRMPKKKVDGEVTVCEGVAQGGVLECPMEQTATRLLGLSEPQGSRMDQVQNQEMLRQMNCLSSTVQKLGEQMRMIKDCEKTCRISNAFASMRKEMKDEVGEGFKNERMVRELAQKEMRSDIRSEIDIMEEEFEK